MRILGRTPKFLVAIAKFSNTGADCRGKGDGGGDGYVDSEGSEAVKIQKHESYK